jgi:hypothetical protein
MYARYYQQYYDYIKGLNPDGSFIPLAVPEPSQVALLLVGLMLVGMYAQKRKRDLAVLLMLGWRRLCKPPRKTPSPARRREGPRWTSRCNHAA